MRSGVNIADLECEAALAFVREELSQAQGIASLIAARPMSVPRVMVPPVFDSRDLLDFESGHQWPATLGDIQIAKHLMERYHSDWWPMYQYVWAREGDVDASFGTVVDGNIYAFGTKRKLELELWRRFRVGFFEVMFLVKHDLRMVARGNREGASRQIAAGVFSVALSAYDNESWIAVDVGA